MFKPIMQTLQDIEEMSSFEAIDKMDRETLKSFKVKIVKHLNRFEQHIEKGKDIFTDKELEDMEKRWSKHTSRMESRINYINQILR